MFSAWEARRWTWSCASVGLREAIERIIVPNPRIGVRSPVALIGVRSAVALIGVRSVAVALIRSVIIRRVLVLGVVIRIVLILRVSATNRLTHEIAPDYQVGCGAPIKPTPKYTSTFQLTCGIAFTCSPVFAFIMRPTHSSQDESDGFRMTLGG